MTGLGPMAREAARSLRRHPLRTGLTLAGFSIGVGAFVAMVAFASGARRAIVSQFEALGTGVLVVSPGGRGSADLALGAARPLSAEDAAAIGGEAAGVVAAAPMARMTVEVAAGSRRATTLVVGTAPDFVRIRAWAFVSGGMFDARDTALGARVCVVGQTVAERLFGAEEAVGRRLRVRDVDCLVTGRLAPLGQAVSGQDQDDMVLMPTTLFERRIAGRAGADRVLVGLAPGADVDAARESVRAVLRARRGLAAAAADDFAIKSPDDLTRVADRSARVLAILLAAIAAVSLVVGGIGIMNILLVSVGERTREIGVRLAIGATPGQVLAQFLVEAALLAGAGASAGAAAGALGSAVAASRLGWERGAPAALVAASIAGGVALGLAFGLYPARRAASLDPVVALRAE